MPRFQVQVDGEIVADFGAEVHFVEVKSSIGPLGEMHPEGQSRINIVTHKRPEFATNLDDVSPIPPAREPQPVELEAEIPEPSDSVEKDTGFKFPTE